MSDQFLKVNGIVVDSEQVGAQRDLPSRTQSSVLRQTLNPFTLAASRNVQTASTHSLPRPFSPFESTPFIYQAADQFFGISQPPRVQSNDAVAQMILNWLGTLPDSAQLYTTVVDRLNETIRSGTPELEDASAVRYFEASLDAESTDLLLKVLNNYEGGIETPVSYTDEELGLT